MHYIWEYFPSKFQHCVCNHQQSKEVLEENSVQYRQEGDVFLIEHMHFSTVLSLILTHTDTYYL